MNRPKFSSETMVWTDRPIERVLAERGIYKNAAEIDPNAPKERVYAADGDEIKNPYTYLPKYQTAWAYSEYCWTNFYPIGCGRLAAMVAGGIDREVIQVNEDTCWDGSPYGTLINENGELVTTLADADRARTIKATDFTGGSRKSGREYYPEIARAALSIDNSETEAAMRKRRALHSAVEEHFLGEPMHQRAYKSFIEVYLDFGHSYKNAENYIKSLNLETGIVTTEYDICGDHIKREVFASYPDQAIVAKIESNSEIRFSARLHTYHDDKRYCRYERISGNEVRLTSRVTDGSEDGGCVGTLNVIKFEARMLLRGDCRFSVSDDNTTVTVSGGRSAELYVYGATNYVDCITLDNEKPKRDNDVYGENIKAKTYGKILERHLGDFTSLFNRTSLTLKNAKDEFISIPTEKRVRKDAEGRSGYLRCCGCSMEEADEAGVYTTYSEGDNCLAVLEFNFGKYLMISGAREGRRSRGKSDIDIPMSRPLNLTGKWNAANTPSWDGKYTININTEMNYWAAQILRLDECESSLIDMLGDVARSGSVTARNQYGIENDRGADDYVPGDPWVTHHNVDLWCGTQPIDNATAGLWPTGGVWLLDHVWQRYLYGRDKECLAEAYPLMLGAVRFFIEFLVTDPKTGYLITAASCSPEHGGVQPGPAMDTQLVRNLYHETLAAAMILGREEEDKAILTRIKEQLPRDYFGDERGKIAPDLIGRDGAIREWVRNDVTCEPRQFGTEPIKPSHRHCSQLWELYPGTHLSKYSVNERELFEAFEKGVALRGAGDGKGWALAWRMCLSARCGDGNTADRRLEQLLRTRTSPNMFDQHPHFQIDGNFGATAGMIEMLLWSHDGAVTLLPALPDRWRDGSFSGLGTREGVTVDLEWKDSKPTKAVFNAVETKPLTVRSPRSDKNKLITLNVIAGERYEIGFE